MTQTQKETQKGGKLSPKHRLLCSAKQLPNQLEGSLPLQAQQAASRGHEVSVERWEVWQH